MIEFAHPHGVVGGAWSTSTALLLPFAVAGAVYAGAVWTSGRRGRRWPWYRTTFWLLGIATAGMTFTAPMPLVGPEHGDFTAHMSGHLLVGMVAPLLLSRAAPVTLALRTLAHVPARRLSRLLRSPPARALTHPVVAAILNIGSLWLLYRTPLYEASQQVLVLHWLIMAHFLIVGYLYTVSLVPVDPSPHRSSFALRSVVLVSSLAAHGILAKLLYAYPPAGVTGADARAGAQLMFYGGDLVDFVLIVLLWAEWYRVSGRRPQSEGRAPDAAAAVPVPDSHPRSPT